jgi:hypothetical protein
MKRLLIAIAVLALLASCAETPSKPSTSGGSSSGSGKVVTATPDEPYECDDDIILEPHLPEECIPPEPVVQKPAEPPKVDPIVGTYKVFGTRGDDEKAVWIWRIYPDNTIKDPQWFYGYTWERKGDTYRADYTAPESSKYWYMSVKYQTLAGEPEIIITQKVKSDDRFADRTEGVKVSNDPDFQFDFFRVGEIAYRTGTWGCANLGRNEKIHRGLFRALSGSPDQYAKTVEQCEALCPEVLTEFRRVFPKLNDEQHTCPQDRR